MIADRIFNEVDLNSGDRGRLHRKIFIMDWGKQLGIQLGVFGCVWLRKFPPSPHNFHVATVFFLHLSGFEYQFQQ